jgi:hypothetical protein
LTLGPIFLRLNDTLFSIPAAGYTFRKQSYIDTANCMIAMTGGAPANTGIFGTYFLASFYTEFDYDAATISLSSNPRCAWESNMTTWADVPVWTNFTVDLINTMNIW